MIKLPKINLKYVLGVLVKVFGLFRHFVGNQRAKHFQKNRYFAIFQTSNRSRFREAWVEVPKPFRVHPAHIWEQLYRILVILAFIPFLKSVPQCKCFFPFLQLWVSGWRHRTWRHRTTESKKRKLMGHSTRGWNPFGVNWS